MMVSELLANPSSRTIRQKECVDKWVANKCRGTVIACTSFGKTNVGLMAIARFQKKNPGKEVVVVVPSDAIKVQWIRDLAENDLKASVITIANGAENKYKCAMLLIDKVHNVPTETRVKLLTNIQYKIILCLTATFYRLDGKDSVISEVAPVIDEIPLDEAVDKGWVSEFQQYVVLIEPDDFSEYEEMNRQFLYYFSQLNYDFGLAMKLATDWKYRNQYIKSLPGDYKENQKNITVAAMGFNRMLQKRKKYINNHPKKIELTDYIIEHRQDKQCITFSNTIAMAEKLKYGKVYSGKDSTKKGRTTLEEMASGKLQCVNTASKLNEGFSNPNISVAVVLGLNSSNRVKTQRVGRVIRPKKGKKAEIFYIVIKGSVEEKWFKNAIGSDKYITLDERGLRNLLEGREYVKKKNKDGNKEVNMKFRF